MKICPQCEKEIVNSRKKYCDDHCKWRFNDLKKDREKHLPPVRKRNKNYFRMVVGLEWDGRGQGRRSGSMIKGAMSAMVRITVEDYAEVNIKNIKKHLEGIPGHIPNGIKLCDGTYIDKMHIKREIGLDVL